MYKILLWNLDKETNPWKYFTIKSTFNLPTLNFILNDSNNNKCII